MEQPHKVDKKEKKENRNKEKLYDRLLFTPFTIHQSQVSAIAVLGHLGIELNVRKDVGLNVHAVQAGIRHRAEFEAASKLATLLIRAVEEWEPESRVDVVKRGFEVGVLYPRANEITKLERLFQQFGIKVGRERYKCPVTFVPLRDCYPDASRGRYIVNPERMADFDYYICCDALYYFTPEEMYRCIGMGTVVAVFHSYYVDEEGEDYLFVEHYGNPAVTMTVEETKLAPLLDGDGEPVIERTESESGRMLEKPILTKVKEEKKTTLDAVSYVATVSHYNKYSKELISYPLANSGHQEAAYAHPLRYRTFLDHRCYRLRIDDKRYHEPESDLVESYDLVYMRDHVEKRVGYDTVVMTIVFGWEHYGTPEVPVPVLENALIVAGRIPRLARAVKRTLIKTQTTGRGFADYEVACTSALGHVLAPYHNVLDFWNTTIENAFKTTQEEICAKGIRVPPIDGPMPRDTEREQKRIDYVYLGVPDAIAKSLADCALSKDRIDFVITSYHFVCDLVAFGYEKLLEGLRKLKEMIRTVFEKHDDDKVVMFENSALFLGVKLLFSAIKKTRTASAFVGWARKYVQGWEGYEMQNPIMAALLDWSVTLLLSFINATSEELARRAMGQSAVVASVMAVVEALLDLGSFYLNDSGGNRANAKLKELLFRQIFRAVLHSLFTLLPLPAAIMLHTLTNMLRAPAISSFRKWFKEFERDTFETQYERVQPSYTDVVDLKSHPDIKVYYFGEEVGTEFLEVCTSPEQEYRQIVLIPNNISNYLVRPSGGVRGGLHMLAERIEVEPKYDPDEVYMSKIEAQWLATFPYAERENKWVKFSRDALLDYVNEHPGFDANKKRTYKQWCEKLVLEKNKVDCYVKTDETLTVKVREQDVLRAKGRPIHPMSETLLDIMCISTPYKESLGSVFALGLWENYGHDVNGCSLENFCPSGPCASFYYEIKPTPKRLNLWFSTVMNTLGSHSIIHGDDNFTLLVYIEQTQGGPRIVREAVAGDISKAERSSRDKSKEHMTAEWMEVGVSEEECKDYRALSFKDKNLNAVDKLPGMQIVFRVRGTDKGLLTGVPPTSAENAFQNTRVLFGTVQHVLSLTKVGDSRQYAKVFKMSLTSVAKMFGVEMVVEPGSMISACSFLGGVFIEDNDQYKWCRLSHYKALLLAPDIESVYSGECKKEQHLWAALQDSYLRLDPIGRAFRNFEPELRLRLEERNLDLFDVRDRYMSTLSSWEQIQHRLVQNEYVDNEYVAESIDVNSYYQGILQFFAARKKDMLSALEYTQGVQKFENELGNISLKELLEGVTTDLIPYYFLRYGEEPK